VGPARTENRARLTIFFFLLGLGIAPASSRCSEYSLPGRKSSIVEVEGVAGFEGNIAAARDEALRDAKRLALAAGASTEIHQRLSFLNGMLRDAAIEMATDAYIENLVIVEEGHDDGVYRLRARARIQTIKGDTVVDDLSALHRLAGNPRILIDINESPLPDSTTSRPVRASNKVRAMFEGDCFGGGFSCIANHHRDAYSSTTLSSQPVPEIQVEDSVSTGGFEFSFLVDFLALDEGPPPFSSENTRLRVVTLDLQGTVLSSDVSRVVASVHVVEHGVGIGVMGALQSALEAAYNRFGTTLMPPILEELIRRSQGASIVEVTLTPLDSFSLAEEIRRAVNTIRGFESTRIRKMSNGICQMSVETSLGDGIWVAQELDGFQGSGWAIDVQEATTESVVLGVNQ